MGRRRETGEEKNIPVSRVDLHKNHSKWRHAIDISDISGRDSLTDKRGKLKKKGYLATRTRSSVITYYVVARIVVAPTSSSSNWTATQARLMCGGYTPVGDTKSIKSIWASTHSVG